MRLRAASVPGFNLVWVCSLDTAPIMHFAQRHRPLRSGSHETCNGTRLVGGKTVQYTPAESESGFTRRLHRQTMICKYTVPAKLINNGTTMVDNNNNNDTHWAERLRERNPRGGRRPCLARKAFRIAGNLSWVAYLRPTNNIFSAYGKTSGPRSPSEPLPVACHYHVCFYLPPE